MRCVSVKYRDMRLIIPEQEIHKALVESQHQVKPRQVESRKADPCLKKVQVASYHAASVPGVYSRGWVDRWPFWIPNTSAALIVATRVSPFDRFTPVVFWFFSAMTLNDLNSSGFTPATNT